MLRECPWPPCPPPLATSLPVWYIFTTFWRTCVYFGQGRRQGGHWAMLPLGAKGALCDCSAPFNRECAYREKAPSNDEKSLQKVPPCVHKENVVGGRSSDALQRRKVPPMTTVRRPPWVKWRLPSPCPPSRFGKYAADFGAPVTHDYFKSKKNSVRNICILCYFFFPNY